MCGDSSTDWCGSNGRNVSPHFDKGRGAVGQGRTVALIWSVQGLPLGQAEAGVQEHQAEAGKQCSEVMRKTRRIGVDKHQRLFTCFGS